MFKIIRKMTVPMLKYYFVQSDSSFQKIMELMSGEDDEQMNEFFKLMMSSYKMEMKPPREFSKKDLIGFDAPVIIFASEDDIFFPAGRVFPRAKEMFSGKLKLCEISGNHLPSSDTMSYVCSSIKEFFAV